MARITLRIPDETLKKIDHERGLAKRSTIITKVLEHIAEQPGYLRGFINT